MVPGRNDDGPAEPFRTAEVVNAAPADLVPALLHGDVEAIVPFPNAYPAAARAPGDDYREIRSDLDEPPYVLAASPAALDAKRGAATRFLGAVVEADAGIEPPVVPDPVNLFQRSEPQADGRLEVLASDNPPGGNVLLRAEKDLLLVVTACSVDDHPTNGGRCTGIRLEPWAGGG